MELRPINEQDFHQPNPSKRKIEITAEGAKDGATYAIFPWPISSLLRHVDLIHLGYDKMNTTHPIEYHNDIIANFLASGHAYQNHNRSNDGGGH